MKFKLEGSDKFCEIDDVDSGLIELGWTLRTLADSKQVVARQIHTQHGSHWEQLSSLIVRRVHDGKPWAEHANGDTLDCTRSNLVHRDPGWVPASFDPQVKRTKPRGSRGRRLGATEPPPLPPTPDLTPLEPPLMAGEYRIGTCFQHDVITRAIRASRK